MTGDCFVRVFIHCNFHMIGGNHKSVPVKLSKKEIQAIELLKEGLLGKFGGNLICIKLFGSRARGDTHAESDIDVLLIVKKRTKWFDNYVIDLICNILNEYGVYLETVTMTKKIYDNARKYQYPFVQNIEKEAVNL